MGKIEKCDENAILDAYIKDVEFQKCNEYQAQKINIVCLVLYVTSLLRRNKDGKSYRANPVSKSISQG